MDGWSAFRGGLLVWACSGCPVGPVGSGLAGWSGWGKLEGLSRGWV